MGQSEADTEWSGWVVEFRVVVKQAADECCAATSQIPRRASLTPGFFCHCRAVRGRGLVRLGAPQPAHLQPGPQRRPGAGPPRDPHAPAGARAGRRALLLPAAARGPAREGLALLPAGEAGGQGTGGRVKPRVGSRAQMRHRQVG